jgi:Cys-tRNA(Pro)/Cys-tRNA(Cys) deacylase
VSLVVKSLLCQERAGNVLALVPGDRSLSLQKVQAITRLEGLKLASREHVESVTGYAAGAVSPLGMATEMPVWADSRLRALPYVYCGGGSRFHMLRISVPDLERLAALAWADLSQEIGPGTRPVTRPDQSH